MTAPELVFQPWPKTPRLFRDAVITEKIDGTNAAVQIREVDPTPYDSEQVPGSFMLTDTDATGARRTYLVQAQSRKRLIYPNADGEIRDNYGFAAWVHENRAGLIRALGEGIHFGEWWGHGIQRGYDLPEGDRRFSLFNTHRHAKVLEAMAAGYIPAVPGLGVVPVLDAYTFSTERVEQVKARLVESGSVAAPGFMNPEGVIVYHSAINGVFKSLIENDDKPKGE